MDRQRNIIVIGASAGGIQAVQDLLALLPSDLPASIFVVIHIPVERSSALPSVIGKSGPLPVRHPIQQEKFQPGTVYVAPPNVHLLLNKDGIVLGRGPRENGHRPAVDPLFRTAAKNYGARVIGVILSGALDDGTAGLNEIQKSGGVTIVQDPSEAEFPSMPSTAMNSVEIDYVLPISKIGPLLCTLVQKEVPMKEIAMQKEKEAEPDRAEGNLRTTSTQSKELSDAHGVFSCPECTGPLWEIEKGKRLVVYECRVGHAYSTESLLENQAQALESAFWVVLRNLEENNSLQRRLLDRSRERGHIRAASHYEAQIKMNERRIALVRQALFNHELRLVAAGERPKSEERSQTQ
jgi:two-component system, chemotaxis family, protein-glutamate methylesterase/glutaminase